MNTLSLNKVLNLLLLSTIFASYGPEKKEPCFEIHDHQNNGEKSLEDLCTNKEDLTEELTIIVRFSDPEALKQILSSGLFIDPRDKAVAIRELLRQTLSDNSKILHNLLPGDPVYDTILICLDAVKGDTFSALNPTLDLDFTQLIFAGNLPLIKQFVEAGFKIPAGISSKLDRIRNQREETIRYFIELGYSMENEGESVNMMMHSSRVSYADFKLYLKHGLPLEYIHEGNNWLDTALSNSDIEIAELVIKKGLRLSKLKDQRTARHEPGKVPISMHNIEKYPIETINYFVKNSYDMSRDGQPIMCLMEHKELTVAKFESYLQKGLPLDYKFDKSNWLEIALKKNRIDIAIFVYKKGLRLSKKKLDSGYIYKDIKDSIDQLIHIVASSKAFDGVIKTMYLGNTEAGSILSSMPVEMIHEIVLPLCEFHKEAAAKQIFI